MFAANKKEVDKEPNILFQNWIDITTVYLYIDIWEQLLFYIYRIEEIKEEQEKREQRGKEGSLEGEKEGEEEGSNIEEEERVIPKFKLTINQKIIFEQIRFEINEFLE